MYIKSSHTIRSVDDSIVVDLMQNVFEHLNSDVGTCAVLFFTFYIFTFLTFLLFSQSELKMDKIQ